MKSVICPHCGEELQIEDRIKLVYCTCCSREFEVDSAENLLRNRSQPK